MIGIFLLIMVFCFILLGYYLLYGKNKIMNNTVHQEFVDKMLKVFIGLSILTFFVVIYLSMSYYNNSYCSTNNFITGSGAIANDYAITDAKYGYIIDYKLSSKDCDEILKYELCFWYNNTDGDNILRFLNGNNLEANFIYVNNDSGRQCYTFTRDKRNSDDYCHSSVGLYCDDCSSANSFYFSRYMGGSYDRVSYNGSFRSYEVSTDYPLSWTLKTYNDCEDFLYRILWTYLILLIITIIIIMVMKSVDYVAKDFEDFENNF